MLAPPQAEGEQQPFGQPLGESNMGGLASQAEGDVQEPVELENRPGEQPGLMGGGYVKVTRQIKNLEKLLRKLNKSVLKTKKKKSVSKKHSKRANYFV